MAMTAEQKAEFAAKKAAAAAKSDDAKSPAPDAEETEETETTPAPAKAVTKPKPANVRAPEGSTAATVAALAIELAAIDKSRDQVLAKIRAAVA